jgi:hypothetical protein
VLLLDVAWRRLAFSRRDADDLAAIVTAGSVRPSASKESVARAPGERSLSRLRRARERASNRT